MQQMMQMMQMMFQFMMKMMEMMMKMFGINPQQPQTNQQQQQQQSPLQQTLQNQYPAQQTQYPQSQQSYPNQLSQQSPFQFVPSNASSGNTSYPSYYPTAGSTGSSSAAAASATSNGSSSAAAAASASNGSSSAAAAASTTNATLANSSDAYSKLDNKDRQWAQGKDLGAVDKNGNPKFLVAQGADKQYHLYQGVDEQGKRYKAVNQQASGSNYLYVTDPSKNKAALSASNNGGSITGASAAAASAAASATNGSASASAAASASVGGASASAAAAASSSAGASAAAAAAAASSGSAQQGGLIVNQGGGTTGSPLILDTNKDGKVSAEAGKGVDINGDGKADGAATGGDKMLAMGDLNGDGKITGKEVFGNETINPFTGQKVNNDTNKDGKTDGFEALNEVAKSAQQQTGIKCIDDNGQVDVQKLKQVLESSGKGSLGMISDNNTSKLEGLGDVSKINTQGYMNQQQTGAVQHNQLGSYIDASGKTQKVNDVWFQLAA